MLHFARDVVRAALATGQHARIRAAAPDLWDKGLLYLLDTTPTDQAYGARLVLDAISRTPDALDIVIAYLIEEQPFPLVNAA
jgi:hypothetical protein